MLQIGINGEILPNHRRYRVNASIEVGNVSRVVLKAISSMLDCYFDVKISPITSERLIGIERRLKTMSHDFIQLFQMNQQIGGINARALPKSRKLHAACCSLIPFLRNFGSVMKADTSSFESIHRVMTVALWNRTSKRLVSMNDEMSEQSIDLNFSAVNDFLEAVFAKNISGLLALKGPPTYPDFIHVCPISNQGPNIPLAVDEEGSLVSLLQYKPLDGVLYGSSVTVADLTTEVTQFLGEDNWKQLSDEERPIYLSILNGMSVESNVESRLGKVFIYAMNSFQRNRPRYDFVVVNQGDFTQPAQVLCILQLNNFSKTRQKYFLYVRYLTLATSNEQCPPEIRSPFGVFKWEVRDIIQGRRRVRAFVQEIVDLDTVMSPAFVVNAFHKGNTGSNVCCRTPSRHDRFWFLERRYCDRANWDDILDDLPANEDGNEEDDADMIDLDIDEFDIYATAVNVDSSDDDDDDDDLELT